MWRELEIRADGNVAHIRASYCLITDKEQREGKDLLTLIRQQGVWKIACLAYEQSSLELRKGGRVSSTQAGMPARPGVQVAGNLADGLCEQARLRPRDPAIHQPGGIVDFQGLELVVWRCVNYPRTPAGKLIRAELARLIGDRIESDQARCQPS